MKLTLYNSFFVSCYSTLQLNTVQLNTIKNIQSNLAIQLTKFFLSEFGGEGEGKK